MDICKNDNPTKWREVRMYHPPFLMMEHVFHVLLVHAYSTLNNSNNNDANKNDIASTKEIIFNQQNVEQQCV